MVDLPAMGLEILHNIVPFLKALGRVWRKWRRLAREIFGNWILDWIGLDWVGLGWFVGGGGDIFCIVVTTR
jgi:hypothetical protein